MKSPFCGLGQDPELEASALEAMNYTQQVPLGSISRVYTDHDMFFLP